MGRRGLSALWGFLSIAFDCYSFCGEVTYCSITAPMTIIGFTSPCSLFSSPPSAGLLWCVQFGISSHLSWLDFVALLEPVVAWGHSLLWKILSKYLFEYCFWPIHCLFRDSNSICVRPFSVPPCLSPSLLLSFFFDSHFILDIFFWIFIQFINSVFSRV